MYGDQHLILSQLNVDNYCQANKMIRLINRVDCLDVLSNWNDQYLLYYTVSSSAKYS